MLRSQEGQRARTGLRTRCSLTGSMLVRIAHFLAVQYIHAGCPHIRLFPPVLHIRPFLDPSPCPTGRATCENRKKPSAATGGLGQSAYLQLDVL